MYWCIDEIGRTNIIHIFTIVIDPNITFINSYGPLKGPLLLVMDTKIDLNF